MLLRRPGAVVVLHAAMYHNSQPGADIVRQAPVPRWGWDVAPPYQP